MGHTAGFATDPSMAPGSCSHFVLFHIFGVLLCFYMFLCFYVSFSLVDQIHPLCIPATKYTLRCQSTGMPSVA